MTRGQFVLLVMCCSVRQIAAQDPGAAIDRLPLATARVTGDQLVITLPLITVPAGGMIGTPIYRVAIPFDASLHGFTVRVLDGTGRAVPRDRLHHALMHDASRRELFLPLALPVFGASKESPDLAIPKFLMGVPLLAGGRYIVSAMFVNPDPEPARFQVELRFSVIRQGRVLPIFRVYPWAIDVTYPLGTGRGRHDFDLLPGHSCHSWQGSPGSGGRIVAITGHAHDYATGLEMVDLTTGMTVWRTVPIRDSIGQVLSIPATHFNRWYRLGIRIESSHVYRARVCYDNPTGAVIPFGGMGSVLGLIAPDRGAGWPRLDPRDPTYQANLSNLLLNDGGKLMTGHDGHAHE